MRGYWQILSPEYEAQRGAAARRAADRDFAALGAPAIAATSDASRARTRGGRDELDGFTAAPFTPEEEARRAAQLIRFLDLVPIEYDDGTDDGQVTIPFELQEAVAFIDGAAARHSPTSSRRSTGPTPAAVDEVEARCSPSSRLSRRRNEGGEVAPPDEIEAAHETAATGFDGMLPEEWQESSSEADFDLIDISLDQMEAAVSAGEREQAEQARLIRLRVLRVRAGASCCARLDPALDAGGGGLIWYGANGTTASPS